jgi:hypothetical protein
MAGMKYFHFKVEEGGGCHAPKLRKLKGCENSGVYD